MIGSPFRDSLTGHFPQGFGDTVFGLANTNDRCLAFRLIDCGTDPRRDPRRSPSSTPRRATRA